MSVNYYFLGRRNFVSIPLTILFIFLSSFFVLSADGQTRAEGPCGAHRWMEGSSWNANGTINDAANSPLPKGIISCGSSASTENALQTYKTKYNSSVFNIQLTATCFNPDGDPTDGIPPVRVARNAPINNQDIVWLNFDVRPFAGTFQYQLQGGDYSWALYYSNVSQAGVNAANSVGEQLSGNCASLTYVECGNTSNGWVNITVPSFSDPANYYIAIWRNDNLNFGQGDNVTFKARYGCGDGDVAPCFVEIKNAQQNCTAATGYYDVCFDLNGANGSFKINDLNVSPNQATQFVYTGYDANGGVVVAQVTTTTEPTLVFGNAASINSKAVTYDVCIRYPVSADYSFQVEPVSTGCTLTPVSQSGNKCCTSPVAGDLTGGTVCFGSTVTLTATTTAGTAPFTYKWYKDNVEIPNETNSTLEISSISTGSYKVEITNGCGSDFSNSVTVTIVADPSVSITAGPQTVCVGGTATLTADASGGAGTCSYQWQSSANGTDNWTNVGTNSTTYNPSTITPGTTYYRVIYSCTGSGCGPATSNVSVVNVNADPSVSITAGPQTVCVGGTATLTASAEGGAGTCSYQWQSSANGTDNWTNVGTNSTTYNPSTTTPGTTYYRVIYSCTGSGCGPATSNVSVVNVNADPSVSITAGPQTVCLGGSATLTATPSGGVGTCTIQWQKSTDGINSWTNVGTNSTTYNPVTTTAGTLYYRVIYSCTGSGCGPATSNVSVVNVDDKVPPVVTCPTSPIRVDPSDYCFAYVTGQEPTITDNCGTTGLVWKFVLTGATVASYPSSGYGTPLLSAIAFNTGTTTVTLTAKDYFNNTNSCSFDVIVAPCATPQYCTFTQGFYGSAVNGKGCNGINPVGTPYNPLTSSNMEKMLSAFATGGLYPPTSGYYPFGNASGNNFKLYKTDITNLNPTSNTYNILMMLPGGGAPQPLGGSPIFYNGSFQTGTWGVNFNKTQGSNFGKITNVLLAQTITLWFNMRNSIGLTAWKLPTAANGYYFNSALPTECGSQNKKPDNNYLENGVCKVEDYVDQFYIPQNVIKYLAAAGKTNPKVGDLFELANLALAATGKKSTGLAIGNVKVSWSEISLAIDAINNGFDQCRIFYGYGTDYKAPAPNCNGINTEAPKKFMVAPEDTKPIAIVLNSRVFPNPHNGIFNIQFTAIADGPATVEVYTMDGKRVQQKALQVRKGTQQTVPFTVPGKSSLIYRVINGGQSSSGRILPN
ncbi:MAG TPA: T9SS type A sorting domain-containing protein [Chitinophagaceae bacterium]|nr:T9SS type A sorting domain-containing protein [Chitinophagaceae bacterium]